MLDHKRKSDSNGTLVPIKKPKNELVVSESENNQASVPRRTSNMEASIMLLSGHEAEIYSAKFHPEGNILASAGFDRQIFLWNVYGDCDNIGVLSGHSGAILELHFNMDGSSLFTASTDKTIGLFNTETGIRVKRMKGHTNFVNSVYPARRGPPLVLSGSDDSTVKIWDSRCRGYVTSIDNVVQVTAVSFNDTAEQILYGGLDNDIKVYDLRKNEILYTLKGHSDTISGLSLSPDGSYLLSNSMDNSLRTWDIRPFANTERCLKVFMGHKHNSLCLVTRWFNGFSRLSRSLRLYLGHWFSENTL